MIWNSLLRPYTSTAFAWSATIHVGVVVAGIAWLPAMLDQPSMSGESNVIYVEFSDVSAKPAQESAVVIEKEPVELPPDPTVDEKPQATPVAATDPMQSSDVSPSDAGKPQVAGTDERTPPNLSSNRPPVYPREAIRRRLEGTVVLRLYIAASGRVERVEVERSSGHAMLDRSATAAVRRWHGRPALLNGVPTSSEELLPVKFKLSN